MTKKAEIYETSTFDPADDEIKLELVLNKFCLSIAAQKMSPFAATNSSRIESVKDRVSTISLPKWKS